MDSCILTLYLPDTIVSHHQTPFLPYPPGTNINRFRYSLHVPCSNTSTVPLPVPPGWKLLKTLYLNETMLPDGFTSTPLIIMIKKEGMLVILVR